MFTDAVASDEPLPDDAALDAILRSEERAGETDPYRHVAALLHLIAQRGIGAGRDRSLQADTCFLEEKPQDRR